MEFLGRAVESPTRPRPACPWHPQNARHASVSDMCICVGLPDVIVKGSLTVLIGGRPAALIGDQTTHGGVIVMGAPTVIVGG